MRRRIEVEEEADCNRSQAGPRKRKDWAGGTLEDEVLSFEHDFKERSTTQSPMPEQTAGADLWLTTDPSGTVRTITTSIPHA